MGHYWSEVYRDSEGNDVDIREREIIALTKAIEKEIDKCGLARVLAEYMNNSEMYVLKVREKHNG